MGNHVLLPNILCAAILLFLTACASTPSTPIIPLQEHQTLALSPLQPPAVIADTPDSAPSFKVYLPPEGVKPTGASIIVLPGGGYSHLVDHEGAPVAEWLAQNGITAFVLRYHLGPKFHYPIELQDAQDAIQTVRFCAKSWHLDPHRIGILGFSAGGHLASTAATHFVTPVAAQPPNALFSPNTPLAASARPDLQILVYPVITMTGPDTHGGSRKSLLGDNPDPALLALLSNQNQIDTTTPPAFLVHSTQDKTVPVANSDDYAAALKAHNIPYQYIRGPHGGHGFGLKDFWSTPCMVWLKKQGF